LSTFCGHYVIKHMDYIAVVSMTQARLLCAK